MTKNFKEEMLNYPYLDTNTIKKDVIHKANQFIQSAAAKSMKARYVDGLVQGSWVVPDFPKGTPTTRGHSD